MAKGGQGKGAKRGVRGTRSGMAGKGRTNAQIKRNPDGSFAKKGTGQVRMGKPKTVKAKSKSVAIKGGASAVIAAKASARKPITAAKRKKLTKQGALEAKVGAIQQRKRAFNKKYKAKLAVEKVKRAQGKLRTASRKQGEMLKAEGYKAQATKRLQYKDAKKLKATRSTIAKPKPKAAGKAAKAQTKVDQLKKNYDALKAKAKQWVSMNSMERNEYIAKRVDAKRAYEKAKKGQGSTTKPKPAAPAAKAKTISKMPKRFREYAKKFKKEGYIKREKIDTVRKAKAKKSMMARPKGDLPRQIVIDERKGQDIKAEIKKVIRSGRAFQVPVDKQGRIDTMGGSAKNKTIRTSPSKYRYQHLIDKYEANLVKARTAPPVLIRTKNGGRYEINPSTYALNLFVNKVLKQGKKKKRKPKAKQQSLF